MREGAGFHKWIDQLKRQRFSGTFCIRAIFTAGCACGRTINMALQYATACGRVILAGCDAQ